MLAGDIDTLRCQQTLLAYCSKPLRSNARTLQTADYRIECTQISGVSIKLIDHQFVAYATLTISFIFATLILIYYSIWILNYLLDVRLPINGSFRPSEVSIVVILVCFWMLSGLIAVGGYLRRRRLLAAPFFYFSGLATLGTWCYYALTLRRVREGTIAADSNIFVVLTAVFAMSIMNIFIYMAVICIDRCLVKYERKLRNEYLRAHRAAIVQQIAQTRPHSSELAHIARSPEGYEISRPGAKRCMREAVASGNHWASIPNPGDIITSFT
ncbi:unnamed protein product [Toxocara canis]|uniref:MARVEL domain-containing protein n=1 Tax=Toxocara canis TaxID=6265 RepID=A0A183UHV5_TOXCA|nr:unnamed protein product [Toxocara canis]